MGRSQAVPGLVKTVERNKLIDLSIMVHLCSSKRVLFQLLLSVTIYLLFLS